MRRPVFRSSRQRGVALIQVLLIFAVLVAIATQLGFRQRITIAGTQTMLNSGQADAWLHSVEGLVLTELQRDRETPFDEDYWGEWSETFDLDPGSATFRIHSLQGRYNLNWLHPSADVDTASEQATRILDTQGLDTAWVQRLSDWFDESSGAEFEYRIEQPGYRPSFYPLADESELYLMETDVIPLSDFALSDWGVFLPPESRLDINSIEQNVFLELHDAFSDTEWSALLDAREDGLSDVDDWFNLEVMQEFLEDHEIPERWFTTEKHYFKMEAEIEYQDRRKSLTSWIYRDSDGNMHIYQRHSLPLPESGLDSNDTDDNDNLGGL